MKRLRNILTVILLALGMLLPATVRAENTVDVKEIVIAAGVPCKVIREITDEDKTVFLP